jgi:hypothetical protein
VFSKDRKGAASKAREKMIAELLAKADEALLFEPGAVANIQQSLAELRCYLCTVKYRDHADADHLWVECAEDLDGPAC